jgi:hypothetical protein
MKIKLILLQAMFWADYWVENMEDYEVISTLLHFSQEFCKEDMEAVYLSSCMLC